MCEYEKNVTQLLTDDSFVAWIEDRASDEEAESWQQWVEEDPARKQLIKNARSLHQKIDFSKERRPEIEKELAQLNTSIDSFEASKNQDKATNVFRIGRAKVQVSVAAVVILLVAVMGVLTITQPQLFDLQTVSQTNGDALITQSTQEGQQKVLTLFDGSIITLNANSSITYPSKYKGGDLEVELKGEAYFDITHKTGEDKRTFAVNVPGATVEVLGTKFNVNTYEQDTEVMLVQGRVGIEMKDSQNRIQDSYIMSPGELSHISQEGQKIYTESVNADLYVSWTQDKLVFEKTPLQKIAQRIGHIYDVEFQMDEKKLSDILVSGSLPNDNLSVFLKALENILNRPITNRSGTIQLGEEKQGNNSINKF